MTHDTDLDKLHPLLREKIKQILTALENEQVPIKLKEGYRSPKAQQVLYEQGDRVKPWYSLFQYGLACDFEEETSGMRRRLSNNNREAWAKLSKLATQQGLSMHKTTIQLPFINAEHLLTGSYPSTGHGGDASWLSNLQKNIEGWPQTPKPNIDGLTNTAPAEFSGERERDEKSTQ